MSDSTADGTRFHQGEYVDNTDYYYYNLTLIQPELQRAPKAVVNAAMSRVGDHMHFDINVQNLSGVKLSSANSAYVTAIVYEDVTHLPPPDNLTDTNRIVRVAPEKAITSLANGAWGNFSIDTIDLWTYDWSKLHGVVVVDYMPGDTGQPYWDMLQGTIASTIPPVSFNISNSQFTPWSPFITPEVNTYNVAITGSPSDITWTATKTAPWLTISPSSGSLPGSLTLQVDSHGLALGSYQDTIHITGTTPIGPITRDVTVTLVVFENRSFFFLPFIRQ